MRKLVTRLLGWADARFHPERKAVLTCVVRIEPSGEYEVTFTPVDVDPNLLVRLIACYFAKIRWILDSEPPQILEAWKLFIDDTLQCWGSDVEDGFLDSLASASHYRKDPEGQWAVAGGETFTVHLVPDQSGEFYVVNHLPAPGLAVNNAWHTVLLLAESRAKLPELDRRHLSDVLLALWNDFFAPESLDPSFGGLNRLTARANEVVDGLCTPAESSPRGAISESQLADDFVRAVIADSADLLPHLESKLSEDDFGGDFPVRDRAAAATHLSEAILAAELQALPNLFDQSRAERLRSKVLSVVESRLGKDSLIEVVGYERLFTKSLLHAQNPLQAMSERLRFRFSPEQGLEEVELVIDPLRSAVVMTYLVEAIGRWKRLQDLFQIAAD